MRAEGAGKMRAEGAGKMTAEGAVAITAWVAMAAARPEPACGSRRETFDIRMPDMPVPVKARFIAGA
jgi:hypothetical protein